MSTSKSGQFGNKNNNSTKRNLPSWMSSRQGSTSSKSTDVTEAKSSASNMSKLMEGVVFVLSGFVNPERGALRSQALEMGAEYKPDWNSECTLLICAFSNTPKFRQVEADAGTIVSKEWITECYNQRKLVEIEPYLMHAGKPWRRQSSQDQKPSTSRKSQKREGKSSPSKDIHCDKVKDSFSPSKVKKWAVDDLNRTISWLESQDERPEPSEMKKIAAEGILTCLQDAIDSLKQGQDLLQIAEQWACIPHVVEELAKLDGSDIGSTKVGKEDLCKQAVSCKQMYEVEYSNREGEDHLKIKEPKSGKAGNKEKVTKYDAEYDSDETIEMTEEEVDQAYNTVASTITNKK